MIDIDKPCINSNLPRQRDEWYSLDIELQDYAVCEQRPGSQELMIDESYVEADFSQTAYDIMSGGIFEKLEHLPKYHDEVEIMKEDAQNT